MYGISPECIVARRVTVIEIEAVLAPLDKRYVAEELCLISKEGLVSNKVTKYIEGICVENSEIVARHSKSHLQSYHRYW